MGLLNSVLSAGKVSWLYVDVRNHNKTKHGILLVYS